MMRMTKPLLLLIQLPFRNTELCSMRNPMHLLKIKVRQTVMLFMMLNIHADPMWLLKRSSIPLNLIALARIWNLTFLTLDYRGVACFSDYRDYNQTRNDVSCSKKHVGHCCGFVLRGIKMVVSFHVALGQQKLGFFSSCISSFWTACTVALWVLWTSCCIRLQVGMELLVGSLE